MVLVVLAPGLPLLWPQLPADESVVRLERVSGWGWTWKASYVDVVLVDQLLRLLETLLAAARVGDDHTAEGRRRSQGAEQVRVQQLLCATCSAHKLANAGTPPRGVLGNNNMNGAPSTVWK